MRKIAGLASSQNRENKRGKDNIKFKREKQREKEKKEELKNDKIKLIESCIQE